VCTARERINSGDIREHYLAGIARNTHGAPHLARISKTKLLYVANAENNFLNVPSQNLARSCFSPVLCVVPWVGTI